MLSTVVSSAPVSSSRFSTLTGRALMTETTMSGGMIKRILYVVVIVKENVDRFDK